MYERHFGLSAQPFGMTPDPAFYFQSAAHREAFAALTYGVRARRGFMTLVGEVGTGKTTLLNALLGELDRSTCAIQIVHTTVDREDLLRLILTNLVTAYGPRWSGREGEDAGLLSDTRLQGLSRAELINEFSAFVNGEFTAYQPPPLIIVDESQNLAVEVLEEIRLLTNLENPKSKMIQVILAGQPELERVLLRSDLRQLRQRIAVHARLEPLTSNETRDYIAHRLDMAGCPGCDVLFTEEAIDLVWSASKGLPRTINVLCDHALVAAFALGKDRVEAIAVRESIQDVLGVRRPSEDHSKPRPYLITDFKSRRERLDRDAIDSASAQNAGGSRE